jgi:hypothetical protein
MMRDWNLQLIWDPLWVGIRWSRDGNSVDVWLGLIPGFPLHFSCWGERWGMPSLDPDDA